MVFSRGAPSLFARTVSVTSPGPVPPGAEVTVTHPVAPSTVHAHCASVVTRTVPVPPSSGKD